jgi:uncharacterized MAPEG superfamily protein
VNATDHDGAGRHEPAADWRGQRKAGIVSIAASTLVAAALWLAIRYGAPLIPGMEPLGARMLFALKCCCVAILFCLVTGVEAVAHERLQSPAFDPLSGHEQRRLLVNQRYLQNTLEQIVIFAAGLFGLAAYSPDGDSMRAVLATAIVWTLARVAFWIGYHRSAAMRGIGAPGMMVSMLVLLYVVARISFEIAGAAGAAAAIGAFLLIELLLFRTTRSAA